MTLRREQVILAAILAGWLVVNLATLSRSPTVWGDEVMFSEAAVRYLGGHGFTVTSWAAAPGTPGVLNGPLYSLLLVPWMGLWGVSATASRSLGLVLVGLSAVVVWALVRRRGWVGSAGLRLVGVGVMLCGHGVVAAARSGRYDGLGLLMVSAAVALSAWPTAVGAGRVWRRAAALGLLGALLPWAGVYLLPYGALLAGVAVLLGGRDGWRRVAPGVVGVVLGLPAWVLAHHLLGMLPAVVSFTAGQAGQPLGLRLAALPSALVRDVSVVPLLAVLMAGLACGLVGCGRAPAGWPLWRLAAVGLLAGLGVPVWMTLAGKCTLFYAWMAYVPALGAVVVWLDRLPAVVGMKRGVVALAAPPRLVDAFASVATRPPWDAAPRFRRVRSGTIATGFGAVAGGWRLRLGRWAVLAALSLAALVGLPLRLAACALEWAQRDNAAMECLVAAHLAPADGVVSGPEAYYASARQGRETLAVVAPVSWPGGIPEHVTALVGGPGLGACLGGIGPEWTAVAHYTPPPYRWPWRLGRTRWYDVTVWRREGGARRK